MREALLPSFYTNMAFRDKVLEIIESILEQKTSLFLVDVTISETFNVIITLDGDKGVNLQDCIDVSRAFENQLVREEQDYSLEVASAGVASPLKMVRQYRKNIGRILKVKTQSETLEAKLVSVNDEGITLSWTAREPKKIGKGKETVEHVRDFSYSEIKEAIVTIIFN